VGWEYKVVQGPKERNINRIITEDELGQFDKQKWELVTAFSIKGGSSGGSSQDIDRVHYIFRRPNK
jgi:hypothetical protein